MIKWALTHSGEMSWGNREPDAQPFMRSFRQLNGTVQQFISTEKKRQSQSLSHSRHFSGSITKGQWWRVKRAGLLQHHALQLSLRCGQSLDLPQGGSLLHSQTQQWSGPWKALHPQWSAQRSYRGITLHRQSSSTDQSPVTFIRWLKSVCQDVPDWVLQGDSSLGSTHGSILLLRLNSEVHVSACAVSWTHQRVASLGRLVAHGNHVKHSIQVDWTCSVTQQNVSSSLGVVVLRQLRVQSLAWIGVRTVIHNRGDVKQCRWWFHGHKLRHTISSISLVIFKTYRHDQQWQNLDRLSTQLTSLSANLCGSQSSISSSLADHWLSQRHCSAKYHAIWSLMLNVSAPHRGVKISLHHCGVQYVCVNETQGKRHMWWWAAPHHQGNVSKLLTILCLIGSSQKRCAYRGYSESSLVLISWYCLMSLMQKCWSSSNHSNAVHATARVSFISWSLLSVVLTFLAISILLGHKIHQLHRA